MLTKSVIYFYILFEILHSLNGETSKGSLTFVIDDTWSMHNEIVQVKEKTNKLFDAVINSNATKVDDFILVTFNDPETKLRTITRDRNEFKRALADIQVDGGVDCPEYAMSGIELALEKSKPNSLIYVYTDAAAKDYALFDRVKSLSLKKSTKVTFLLTGQCENFNHGFIVYDKLAAATSGQVFHIGIFDVTKIIDYIIETVKHVKTTLAQKFFVEGSGKTIQFNVDSKSWDIIVSVSAINPNFHVIGPDGRRVGIETDKSITTEKTRIEKLKVNPGLHTIFLDTNGPTSVVVTASTSVTFEHGFSTIQPESLNETAIKPIPGDKSHLAISLDNSKKDVKLKNFEIRDTEDNVIYTFPLKLINEDTQFYATEGFMPPSKSFKIAVIGYTESGEKIVRLGSTTIEPQDDKSVCETNITFNRNMPLFLTVESTWILTNIIRINSEIKIDCINHYISDGKRKFISPLYATCIGKTIFKTQYGNIDISELKCDSPIELVIRGTSESCIKGNSELVQVGFEIETSFLSVYDVCIDKVKNNPRFIKYAMNENAANSSPKELLHFVESSYMPFKFKDLYDCSKQVGSIFAATGVIISEDNKCCFARKQLVSPKDMLPGLPQLATYHYMNVIAQWSTCGTENWDEVERRIRSLAASRSTILEVWTGSSDSLKLPNQKLDTFVTINDKYDRVQRVPRYIWKLVISKQNSGEGSTEEGLAIVVMNSPNLKAEEALKQIPCKRDICNETKWMYGSQWHDPSKGFVFCCDLKDFMTQFSYNNLFPSMKPLE